MGKVMKSVAALLVVPVCASSVVFAVMTDEKDFPEALIGEEVNEEVINLSDMAYVVLDDSQIVIDGNLIRPRAMAPVSWSVKANILKMANTTFLMEAGEYVTINCSYTPRWADVDFGPVAPDDRFYYLPGEEGSINRAIRIDERGEYRFGVYNKSSNTVSMRIKS